MKRIVLCFYTLLLLSASLSAQAAIINFSATLTGSKEVPPNTSPGTGLAILVVNDLANTMSISVNWDGLTGTTTMAHIHCCTAQPLTSTAPPATAVPSLPGFPTGVTSGSYNREFSLLDASTYSAGFITASGGTVAGARAAFLAGLAAERSYLNLHTTAFPGGEIRGFFTQIPEPGSIALLSLGAAGLGVLRRRRHMPAA